MLGGGGERTCCVCVGTGWVERNKPKSTEGQWSCGGAQVGGRNGIEVRGAPGAYVKRGGARVTSSSVPAGPWFVYPRPQRNCGWAGRLCARRPGLKLPGDIGSP